MGRTWAGGSVGPCAKITARMVMPATISDAPRSCVEAALPPSRNTAIHTATAFLLTDTMGDQLTCNDFSISPSARQGTKGSEPAGRLRAMRTWPSASRMTGNTGLARKSALAYNRAPAAGGKERMVKAYWLEVRYRSLFAEAPRGRKTSTEFESL